MTLERDLAAGADPLGWLALADMCEDWGALADAARWRRRAACLRAVLELRKLAEYPAGPRLYRFDLAPGWAVSAYLTPREVRTVLMRDPSPPPLHDRVVGRYHLPRASLLGHTQRDPKMAARYLRRKAFEWAEMLTAARPCSTGTREGVE